jgi:type II secretory pathway predicted ATPase ExeA/chromosome segregation ATPase
MRRAPFGQVSDAAEIFHAEQYSLLYEHLANSIHRSDYLLVLCGADGSGKTTLLNRYIASLTHDDFFASFDETCSDAAQFHCGLLRQLGFNDITGTLNELRHISREFLIHRGLAGDHVLLVVDNAHLVSPTVLEQLRWLSDITAKDRRVISVVLSGNLDLPRIMDSPAMRSMQFEDHIDFTIRVYTEQETDEYVRHRLRLAGGLDSAKLSNASRPLIHRFSGGIPSLINRLCDAVLTEAFAQETRVISEELVRDVAETHKFVPHVVPLQGKGRRRTDSAVPRPAVEQSSEERISQRQATTQRNPEISAPDPDIEVTRLLVQVTRLADELTESRAERDQAVRDVAARDADITALLNKIAAQAKDAERMAAAARDSAVEFEQLTQSLSDKARALQNTELDLGKLATELEHEKATGQTREAELSEVRRKLEKLEGLKVGLRDSVKDLKAELKQAKAEARDKLKSRDVAIAELENSLLEVQTERDSLQAEAAAAAELERTLHDVRQESDLLRSEAEAKVSLETSLAEARTEIDALRTDAEATRELERSLDEARAEIDALRAEAEAAKALQSSLRDAREESDALRSDAEAKSLLEQALAEARVEIDALRAEAEAAKALESSLRDAREESDALRSDAEAKSLLEQALAEARVEIDALRAEADAAKALESSLHEARQESDALRSDAEAKSLLEQSLAEARAEIDVLKAEAETSEGLKVALAEAQQENELLRSDAAALADLEATLAEAQKECSSLRTEAAVLQDLEKSLVVAENENESLRSKVASAEALKKSLDEALKECDSLRSETAVTRELESSLDEARAEIDTLRAGAEAAKELQRSLDEVHREHEALQTEVTAAKRLKDALAEKDSHIDELQGQLVSYIEKLAATQEVLAEQRSGSHSSMELDDTANLRVVGAIASFEVLKGGEIDQVFTVEPGQSRIMIGRSDDSDLRLDSRFVSRHHALVFLNAGRAHIEDLHSYNGTIVNGEKASRCNVNPGDKIVIGDYQLRPKGHQ